MLMKRSCYILLLCCFVVTAAQAQLFNKSQDPDALYTSALAQTRAGQYAAATRQIDEAIKLAPKNTDYRTLKARLLLLQNRPQEALPMLQRILAADPRNRDAYFYAINSATAMARQEDAVCYIEEALYYFPRDRELAIKKLGVLDNAQQFGKANAYAEDLWARHPDDSVINRAYIDHYLYAGGVYAKNGNTILSRMAYEKVLEAEPANAEASAAVLGLYLKTEDYDAALTRINAALAAQPGNYELLMRKLGIQQETHRYADALATLQTIRNKYPNDPRSAQLENALRLEAAAYYSNIDPYMLYLSVLEKDPNNNEALQKVIGLTVVRGAYEEALGWINRGLRTKPNDPVLSGQKVDMLEHLNKYTEAAQTAQRLWRQTRNSSWAQRTAQLKNASGRYYLGQQQYTLALQEFEDALSAAPGDRDALNNLVNCYIALKQTDNALLTVQKALQQYPDDEALLSKETAILSDAGRYEEAAQVARRLLAAHPGNAAYGATLADQQLAAGRILMQAEDYDLARTQLQQVLAQQPNNLDALNYLINLESGAGRPDSALAYANRALAAYPDDRELLLKKASILQTLQRYTEAAAMEQSLMERYPYTLKYRNAYTETLMAQGDNFRRNQEPDSALAQYEKVLALRPKDSLALLYTANAWLGRQQPDSALPYIDRGIRYYPASTAFLEKRANVLEARKDYAAAALAADSLQQSAPSTDHRAYADFLQSKGLRNQFGMYYLNSTYDYNNDHYNVATLEYRHYIKKGSYAFRVGYAGRQEGTGIQGEAELYYNHSAKTYSYALLTGSNGLAFPQVRAAYSLFHTFPHGFEGEIGARYLHADSTNSVSGVVSIAKSIHDFWANFRTYLISEDGSLYTSFNLTTRYYMNQQQDYISFVAALGTSPDDRSRLIAFPQLVGLLTRSVGAGFQKTFRFRTTIGVNGTWINQKISDSQFQNQYDLYFTLLRKF